jgi:hypothetical protein
MADERDIKHFNKMANEAKQRAANYMSLKGALEPKQETLEERINYISTLHLQNLNGRETDDEIFEAGIEAGIKETEERMYSEAIEFGKWLDENMQQRQYYPMMIMAMEELFEQFKNK